MLAAAEYIVQQAADAMARTGRFLIALSGGSTPIALYELLARPRYAERIAWSAVHVCFGDERCVPPDDPQSNYRMTWAALLDHVPVPRAQVHRMRGEDAPEVAAWAYERDLRALFDTPLGAPRHDNSKRFDLVLLGLGADGHTASLFPNGTAVRESTRWVVPATGIGAVSSRLTVTLPVINAAANVLFLVTGANKADALHQVRDGPADVRRLPAQGVSPTDGQLIWLVDREAAASRPEPA